MPTAYCNLILCDYVICISYIVASLHYEVGDVQNSKKVKGKIMGAKMQDGKDA